MIGRASDRAIHASVAALLPDVLAASDSDWARTTAMQLSALASYASRRPADPTETRAIELRDVLGDAGVGGSVGDDSWERAAEVLRSSLTATEPGAIEPGAIERRAAIREVLVRQLDDELASTSVLMDAFRAKPSRA